MYAMYTQIVGKGTKNERNIINYYRSGRKVTKTFLKCIAMNDSFKK